MAGAPAKRQPDAQLGKDGGTLGWLAVLGAFGCAFAWVGISKTLAVMLPTLQDQFDAQTWLVGWMIAIIDSVIDITGPLTSPLIRQFGVRAVVMVSGMLLGLSTIVASFSTNLGVITMLLAGFAAPAVGISYIAMRELIGQCFNKSYARAYGIAFLGNSLAYVIFAPLAQFFLDVYGWRAALMLIGAVLSNLVVCGALLRSRTETHGRIESSTGYVPIALKGEEISSKEDCKRATCCSLWTSVCSAFSLDLFASPVYWLLACINVCIMTIGTAWLIYFAAHTNQSKGFPLSDVATFVSVYGIGNIVSCFLIGFFHDSEVLMGVSIAVTSISLLIDPWLTAYWPIMVNMVIYGCFHCFTYVLIDVITKTAIGVDRLGSALGWMALQGSICRLLLLFFPGLIYDMLGSYTLAFIVMGVVNALALPALLVLIWMQRRNQ